MYGKEYAGTGITLRKICKTNYFPIGRALQIEKCYTFLKSVNSFQVVVTNTVPHDVQKLQCHKIKTVDVSILLAEAIRRIHNKESMSHLFRHVRLED